MIGLQLHQQYCTLKYDWLLYTQKTGIIKILHGMSVQYNQQYILQEFFDTSLTSCHFLQIYDTFTKATGVDRDRICLTSFNIILA